MINSVHSIKCDDYLWNIQKCSNGFSALCINCADPCTATNEVATSTVVSSDISKIYRYTSVQASQLNSIISTLIIATFDIYDTSIVSLTSRKLLNYEKKYYHHHRINDDDGNNDEINQNRKINSSSKIKISQYKDIIVDDNYASINLNISRNY
jgi:hypothetical protein